MHEQENIPLLDKMPTKHEQELIKLREQLIEAAQSARSKEAVHYNQFLVGAATLSYNEKKGIYHISQGGNKKTKEGFDPEKKCAEAEAIERITDLGDSEIIAIAVSCLETQTDLHNGVTSATLHPCQNCRQLFVETPSIKPWTKIITTNDSDPDNSIEDTNSVFELAQMHKP